MHRAILLIGALCALTLNTASARDQSDLATAYRVIASKTFVDLTHSFGPQTPVWSGFGQAKFSPAADPKTHEPYTIAKDGFRATYYEMVGQYGTHVDPPAHFAPDGITMDQIPLKQMILPLVVLDDTPYLGKDPNHAFSVADLKAWERAHGRVPKGAFAALRTDMYRMGLEPRALQAPAVPGLGLRDHQIPLRTARRDRDRARSHGHRHHRQDGFRNLHSPARPLSDRGHGQSGQSAGDRRGHRGDVAESGKGFGLPGPRVCDFAVAALTFPDAVQHQKRVHARLRRATA